MVTFIATVIDEPEGIARKAVRVGDFFASSDMDILVLHHRGRLNVYTDLDEPTSVNNLFNVALPDILAYSTDMTVADVNGDGRSDLLATLPELVWYRHIDNDGQHSEARIIDDSIVYLRKILVFDLDGDHDLDVLAGSRTYRNADGQGSYELLGQAEEIAFSAIGDIDGDGDIDVAGGTPSDGVAWCRNTDGYQTFDDCTEIQSGFDNLHDIELMDVDGDGDNDIVLGETDLSWMENSDGLGDFLHSRHLTNHNVTWVDYVAQADINGDGKTDLVYTSNDSVGWLQMTESGLSDTPQLIAIPGHWRNRGATDVADIDGDGDLDVVVARRNEIVWYENRIVGDANDDGAFDPADLVAVLAAGKYENDASDATFDEGDWDQDGDFDSTDLVLAFQAGHYQSTAIASRSHAAAADLVLALNDDDRKTPRVFIA